jgi:molecular chaperone DnaK (HSP70)
LIGEAAKNQAAMNPANTVFDIKSVRRNVLENFATLTAVLQAPHRTEI